MYPALDKAYAPGAIEPRWAQAWVQQGLFEVSNDDPRPAWSLVIPPPNVTGSLHVGHMLEHTLIDMVVRWERMRGRNALWLPGTDHAGIATQMVVERALAAEGKSRTAMGREAFVEAVWEWKRQSGDRIRQQMVRLGASCDWSRARFTLDAGLSRAVREVFVRLYEEGLIYRGRYIVNWCPRCQTAVSDLEVTHKDIQGKLYRVKYAVAGAAGSFLEIATTRPETILADVAVAVNPADRRYSARVGETVEVPLTGRTVPIIADEIAQPEFGTGVVKITPGHDVNDYAAGQRHQLPQLVILDETGHLAGPDAGAYAGLDRFEARRRIVHDLDAAGLLGAVTEHAMAVGHCQRCGSVIEPRISDQWFVKIAPLAADAVAAVGRGEIRFVPENNTRIFYEWMANIHDWCISRQLWWGHRIPAWHCERCGKIIVAREDPAACACGGALRQDSDVLDTWFSSGLWPFSTLGWPEPTRDLEVFYPTSVLITGFDILFFWVARMIMLGVHFMPPVPFREVYIHALVRDAGRQKMSKTKGNVIDPLEVTEKYGTDAVRFTLAAMAAPGTDIALAEERMQGYAAFANKIWNAARFIFLQLERLGTVPRQPRSRALGEAMADRWIFSRLNAVAASVNTSLEQYRFHDAADTLYHFIWHEFCDWYIELLKPRLEAHDTTAGDNLWAAFETALRLLHPVMPFVTEELWHAAWASEPPQRSIAFAAFPQADAAAADPAAEIEIARLQAVVTEIRRLRTEAQVPPGARARVQAHGSLDWDSVAALTRTEVHRVAEPSTAVAPVAGVSLKLELGPSERAAHRARMEKERAALAQGVAGLRAKLANDGFRARAPQAVLEETERLAAEREAALAALDRSLADLG